MPFHVRITPHSTRGHDEVRLDLTESQLEERFIRPYREGRPLTIGGRTIDISDLERLKITFTEEDADHLLPIVQAEQRQSGVFAFGISDEWLIADRGRDVTDEFITGRRNQLVSAT